jgi:hypothetical protein
VVARDHTLSRQAAEKVDAVHEMRVMAVGVEPGAYRPVLLLQEASEDHRLLLVWIGAAKANMIVLEQQGIVGRAR